MIYLYTIKLDFVGNLEYKIEQVNINLTSISKSYFYEEIIVQNFDNLSSLLQNPQILNMLQQMNNNQNDSINGECDNKIACNNANAQQQIQPNMQNLQMISNMMSMLNGNSMQNLFSIPNNMNIQSVMMLMNLISQMQNNNTNNLHKKEEDENK